MATLDSDVFDAEELLALAQLALDSNDVEGALRKLKQVVGGENPPGSALALTARVYAQLKLFDRAEELYRRYLAKHPDAFLERFQLGMTRFDRGEADQALITWDEVLKKEPTFPPALFYKGLALVQTGNSDLAKQVLNTLLKSIPADNLYFERAKELLQSIEAGAAESTRSNPGNGNAGSAGSGTVLNAYRTEH